MPEIRPFSVVVVARDEAVRDSLGLLLQVAECAVLAFGSGAAFLAAAAAREADCLVLDEEIGDMTAWEMMRRLRSSGATIVVALFTGRRSSDLLRRAAQEGIAQVLEAPLMAAGLVEFVAQSRRSGGRGDHA
jgi:FixJ family two-component response regulator